MEIHIKNLKEIDWDAVFPGEDVIIWKNKKWLFSDTPGHFIEFVGPAIESVDKPKQYFDTHSGDELKYYVFDDSFLGDNSEGVISYLLPVRWTEKQVHEWFEQYKKDRSSQEEVRREMLDTK